MGERGVLQIKEGAWFDGLGKVKGSPQNASQRCVKRQPLAFVEAGDPPAPVGVRGPVHLVASADLRSRRPCN